MKFDMLTEDNFLLFAMKVYDNPQCKDMEEFYEDINRIKYLKRLFKKYKSTGTLRERLILNHLIIFTNVFGIIASNRILFHRIEKELHPYLKTFLVYLNLLPENIPEIELKTIPLDKRIIDRLRKIETNDAKTK
jgi:hypothetical protein